jgi:hypothetical protein
MTPEEKSLLERTYKIVEDNNTILRGIRRANRISAGIRIFYWLVIVGATLGLFYYMQPYIDSMFDLVGEAQKSIQYLGGTVNQVQGTIGGIK